MIRTFATTATALCLAAPFVLAGPQDDAQARNYLLSGEMIVFSAAEQRLPAGWSLAVDGVPAGHAVLRAREARRRAGRVVAAAFKLARGVTRRTAA